MGNSSVELQGTFWGVTCYFNPAGYNGKLANLRAFAARVRLQGLKLMVIEAATPGSEYSVPSTIADRVIRVRAPAVLWLKERLLNLGITMLPADCDKVAWLDGDILFTSDAWVFETSELLRTFVAVQPFTHAHRLKQGAPHAPPLKFDVFRRKWVERSYMGIAFREWIGPGPADLRGHEGFAWAARRTLIEKVGLYDKCIVGGGDTFIASAMYGALPQDFVDAIAVPCLASDISKWMADFYAEVQGSVGFTWGEIYHLWHGDHERRQYVSRYGILSSADFDPRRDITLSREGCWRWATNKTALHLEVAEYFGSRDEDGKGNQVAMDSRAIQSEQGSSRVGECHFGH